MSNPIISCGIYAAEMVIFYLFFSLIAVRKTSRLVCLICGLFLFEIGSAVNLLFHNNVLLNTITSICSKALFAYFFFNIKTLSCVFYSVVLDAINFALEIVTILIASVFVSVDAINFDTNLPQFLIICVTNKLLLLLVCLILSRIVKPSNVSIRFPLPLLFFPICISVCYILLWVICGQEGITSITQAEIACVCILLFGATVFLLITYQRQLDSEKEHLQTKNELGRLQTEKEYYDILNQQNQQLMIYAHDAKNHLAAIQSICQDPLVQDYVAKLSGQLKSYASNCHSGNMMLDVIINKYVLACERCGIAFEYEVRSCNLASVEDLDLVAILGNLLDNALTSAKESDRKILQMETSVQNGYQVINIRNSCSSAPITDGGKLCSTKNDAAFHGFGLKSVARTLKKYDGDFAWEYDEKNREFMVTVMIG